MYKNRLKITQAPLLHKLLHTPVSRDGPAPKL